ncbi:MAG: hypothetical protein J6T41_03810, partial [Neisseriaceae bacterium]|nr:hypothetical protein [Neisseriaceae bacterium]
MKHTLLFLLLSAVVAVAQSAPQDRVVRGNAVSVEKNPHAPRPHHRPPPPPPRHHPPPPPRPVPYYGDYPYYGSSGMGGSVHIGKNTGHSSVGVNIGFDNRVYYPSYPNY